MQAVQAEEVILDGEMCAYDSVTGSFVPFGQNSTVVNEQLRNPHTETHMVRVLRVQYDCQSLT